MPPVPAASSRRHYREGTQAVFLHHLPKKLKFCLTNIGRKRSPAYILRTPPFGLNASLPPQSGATVRMVTPLAGAAHQIAGWFHVHLSQAFVDLMRAFSDPGSAQWSRVLLFLP